MPHFSLLYNPAAAAGKNKKQFEEVKKYLNELGIDYSLYESEYPSHIIELAKELAEKGEHVVGVGGDGTCNEVLNGVLKSSSRTPIGFIPMGSGNDIPGALQIPPNPKRACEILSEGNIIKSDVGIAYPADGDPRYFLGIGSQGFDALVTQKTNAGKKRLSGTWNYIVSVVKSVFTFKRRSVHIKFDNVEFEGVCNLVAVGNGPSYGGWMYMCPEAKIDDGLFDITIVNMKPLPLLFNFNKLYDRSLMPHPRIQTFRSKTVEISMSNPNDENYIIQVDGEIIGHLPVKYEILPKYHEFYAPSTSEVDKWFEEKYKKPAYPKEERD